MMKRILLILMIIGFGTLQAQNNSLGESDPAAKTILKKVSSKYKAFKSFAVQVQMTAMNPAGQQTSSMNGSLEMKGNKFYIKSADNVSFSDGTNMFNFDKDANEMQITRVNPKDNLLTPPKLFTDFYDKNYLYKLNGETRKGMKTIQEIELTPFDKTLPFFKVLLEINKTTSTIESAKIFEKNGNRYTYTITSLKTGVTIPDSRFSFSQKDFPGAEVVDLR